MYYNLKTYFIYAHIYIYIKRNEENLQAISIKISMTFFKKEKKKSMTYPLAILTFGVMSPFHGYAIGKLTSQSIRVLEIVILTCQVGLLIVVTHPQKKKKK